MTENHHRIAHRSPKFSAHKGGKAAKKPKNEHLKKQQNLAIMKKRIFNFEFLDLQDIPE